MQRMEEMIENLTNNHPMGNFGQEESQIQPLESADVSFGAQGKDTAFSNQADDQLQCKWEVVMDSTRGPGAIPASCVSEVSTSSPVDEHGPTTSQRSDIISQGLLSLATAETYFSLYHQHLDHLMYNLLAEQELLAASELDHLSSLQSSALSQHYIPHRPITRYATKLSETNLLLASSPNPIHLTMSALCVLVLSGSVIYHGASLEQVGQLSFRLLIYPVFQTTICYSCSYRHRD